ncbi:MAG: hypothetical protein LLG97_05630 [Deltaproteobacteria bacterium]|nr:hypothetical protein [Deltaproteobacteria bacterium]
MQLFRADLLEGEYGDPVENDPAFRSRGSRVRARVTASDRQQKSGEQEGG